MNREYERRDIPEYIFYLKRNEGFTPKEITILKEQGLITDEDEYFFELKDGDWRGEKK